MIRYAANLTMLYNEVPFLERFEKAAASGFRAVEFLFIHNVDAGAVERELKQHGLELVLFDPDARWRVEPGALASTSSNTPLLGMELPGVVRLTVADGRVTFRS